MRPPKDDVHSLCCLIAYCLANKNYTCTLTKFLSKSHYKSKIAKRILTILTTEIKLSNAINYVRTYHLTWFYKIVFIF